MIRIAAVGDIHFERDAGGPLRPLFERLDEEADLLLIAGDLTHHGDPEQARALASELKDLPVPIVAVLGNHDYSLDREGEIAHIVSDAGVTVLEGDAMTIEVEGRRVGVAGTTGFGGGWPPCWQASGEPETRAFIGRTQRLARGLEQALSALDGATRIALLHYSPVETTIANDPPQLWPWLGSYLLGEALDNAGADLALHGHVHLGIHKGDTPGGVPVRNVSRPLLGRPFAILRLDPEQGLLD
ncbi:MAG: metallophosphoesterase family protein [Actinomycetota bacterium]